MTDRPLFCVGPDTYETMARNEAEKLRYARDLRALLDYYRGLD